jgi:N-acylglucosamine-6-phosphate 2-epimerase
VEEAVDALMECGADIIAMDATRRIRPFGLELDDFFHNLRNKYPDMLFMADCAEFEDALHAEELGFDLAGTTLCGYTRETKGTTLPKLWRLEYMLPLSELLLQDLWISQDGLSKQ